MAYNKEYMLPSRFAKLTRFLASFLAALTLATVFSTCRPQGAADDTDPEPIIIASPIANLEYIFDSAPGNDGNVRVTALSGAVIGDSAIVATNTTTGATATATASSNGAFQLEIAASDGDTLTLAITSAGETESASFAVSLLSPTPLSVNQTDVAVDSGSGKAYVSVSGTTGTSLVELSLTDGRVSTTHGLSDPDTGTALTDLTAIQVFSDARIAVVIDRTELKFYLVDLTDVSVMPDPIAITGNFATIVRQNETSFRIHFDGVDESETYIRQAIQGALVTLNNSIETLPDAGTNVILDGSVGSASSDILFAGAVSNNVMLARFIVTNETMAVTSEENLVLSTGEVGGLAVFADRSKALVANESSQTSMGNNRFLHVVDLSGALAQSQTIFVDGIPSDVETNANETELYVSLSDKHQLATFSASSLTQSTTHDTGPTPGRLAIGTDDALSAVLNAGDTTVSFVRF